MNGVSLKDLRATHTLLNLLYSQFQGWYTQQQILVQLQHPSAAPDVLPHGADLLDTVADWRAEFHRSGYPLIWSNGQVGETGIESEIGGMLQVIFDKLVELGGTTQTLIQNPIPLSERVDDASYLIAAVGWHAFAAEHERQNSIEYANQFADHDLLQALEADGDTSGELISLVGEIITYLRSGSQEPTLFDLVCSLAEPLPEGDTQRSALAVQRYLPFFSDYQN